MDNVSLLFDNLTTTAARVVTAPPSMYKIMYANVVAFFKVLAIYIFPVIGTVGCITNAISIYVFVFCWEKPSRQTIYLAYLSFCDLFCLVIPGWLYYYAFYALHWLRLHKLSLKLTLISEFSCKLYRYLSSLSSTMACTALLLVVMDRTFSIYFPFKASLMGKRSAWMVCAGVTLGCMLIILPYGTEVGWYMSGGWKDCWITYSNPFLQAMHFAISNVGIVQTTLIILFNVALIMRVVTAIRERKALTGTDKKASVSSKEISASLLVLMLSLGYVLCAGVQVVGYSISFANQYLKFADYNIVRFGHGLGDVGWYFFFLQESTSFFIYVARMAEFRSIVKAKFCCCCRTRRA